MSTESARGTADPLQNQGLAAALAGLSRNPSDEERRSALRDRLSEGPLWLALREPPGEADGDAEPREWKVRFVSSRRIEGDTWLCAYTSARAAADSAPGAVWVALEPLAVMRFAVDAGYAGLLFDPQGRAVAIGSGDLGELIRQPEPQGPARRALSLGEEPENAVRGALERVMERPYGEAGVRVREPRTGKHVQFALTPDGALMMDVPRSSLGRDEAERARMLLKDLSGHALDGDGPDPEAFQAIFCDDTGRAAKATLKVFTWVFGFPPGFALEIDEPAASELP